MSQPPVTTRAPVRDSVDSIDTDRDPRPAAAPSSPEMAPPSGPRAVSLGTARAKARAAVTSSGSGATPRHSAVLAIRSALAAQSALDDSDGPQFVEEFIASNGVRVNIWKSRRIVEAEITDDELSRIG